MRGFRWFCAKVKIQTCGTSSFIKQMFRFTKPQGTFATFTAASAVRKGLENVGFDITKRKGFGKNENVSLVKNA